MQGEWISVNHNGTVIQSKPSTRAAAKVNAEEYTWATSNPAYILPVKEWKATATPFQIARSGL